VNCACGNELVGRQRKWCSEQCSKDGARAARLAQVFNLTPEEYDQILEYQGGVCAICGSHLSPVSDSLSTTTTSTGFVRGLLCFLCNKRVLGARSAEVLVKTAAYVTDPPARKALGRDVVANGRPKKKRPTRKRKR
jgi:hypothetical protein